MTIERKSCAPQIKRVSAGQATVVIATLGVRDKDGDVIMPGFFGQQDVPVAPAHDWHAVPIGKAHVYEAFNEALADITFNLDTTGGKDWHAAIKFDFEHPPSKQEYSFGFRILEGGQEPGDHAGERVRFLKPLADGRPGLDMVEVSPVMRGAGQHTRTVDVKEEGDQEGSKAPPAESTDVKHLTLEQLIMLMDTQIEHLLFVQDMRERKGKMLAPETVAMVDETSKRFDALRARLNLGQVERDSTDEELTAKYAEVTGRMAREEEVVVAYERAENEDLVREALTRLERIGKTLHP